MSHSSRDYSFADQIILQLQAGLETILGKSTSQRKNPAQHLFESDLTTEEKKQSAGYMRVNHSGEVCAQALYRGQQVSARRTEIQDFLSNAAHEETDHLAWCAERLKELNSHRSYLNAFWYVNAFMMGVLAGCLGDQWSLGFVEETEKQVEAHLASHLNRLPSSDEKSRQIVEQMKQDETTHGHHAKSLGAKNLPDPIKKLMAFHAKVMTLTSYWI